MKIFKRFGKQVAKTEEASVLFVTKVLPLAEKLKGFSPTNQDERDLQHIILVSASRWLYAKKFFLTPEQLDYLEKKCMEAQALIRKIAKKSETAQAPKKVVKKEPTAKKKRAKRTSKKKV